MTKVKLVYGVGINDADYTLQKKEKVGGSLKMVWRCPFYTRWVDMLRRCYSSKLPENRLASYRDCFVIEEWLYFSKFKAWMEQQDWEGKHLDKDILIPGNKKYGPDTCVFVEQRVNAFVVERAAMRGEFPIGTYFKRGIDKYMARCCSVVTGKMEYLGYYNDPEEAHQAWLAFKLQQAYILASEQTDIRVAKALINRYENYKKGEPYEALV